MHFFLLYRKFFYLNVEPHLFVTGNCYDSGKREKYYKSKEYWFLDEEKECNYLQRTREETASL